MSTISKMTGIRIERIDDAIAGTVCPRLLKASAACPPEEVDGAPDYEVFLAAYVVPRHEQRDDMVHWSGVAFERIAKKRAPRARKPNNSEPYVKIGLETPRPKRETRESW